MKTSISFTALATLNACPEVQPVFESPMRTWLFSDLSIVHCHLCASEDIIAIFNLSTYQHIILSMTYLHQIIMIMITSPSFITARQALIRAMSVSGSPPSLSWNRRQPCRENIFSPAVEIFLALSQKYFQPCRENILSPVVEIFLALSWKYFQPCRGNIFSPAVKNIFSSGKNIFTQPCHENIFTPCRDFFQLCRENIFSSSTLW